MCTACVTLQEKAEVLFCQYFRKSWQGGNKNLSHFILHTLQWTVRFQLRDHSWLQHSDRNFRKRPQNHLDPPTTSIYLASFPCLVPRPSLSFPSLAVFTVLQATGSWTRAWERGYSFPGSLFESLGTRLLSTYVGRHSRYSHDEISSSDCYILQESKQSWISWAYSQKC